MAHESGPHRLLAMDWLFPGREFRRHKAAVKMHTPLELRGNLPAIPSLRGRNGTIGGIDNGWKSDFCFFGNGSAWFPRITRRALQTWSSVVRPIATCLAGLFFLPLIKRQPGASRGRRPGQELRPMMLRAPSRRAERNLRP